jgi:hypothetical protein
MCVTHSLMLMFLIFGVKFDYNSYVRQKHCLRAFIPPRFGLSSPTRVTNYPLPHAG